MYYNGLKVDIELIFGLVVVHYAIVLFGFYLQYSIKYQRFIKLSEFVSEVSENYYGVNLVIVSLIFVVFVVRSNG